MREILFRGKRVDNGEWVEGNLFIPDLPTAPTQILIGTNVIRINYDVIPETVGQYIGLVDKNGKKIFEGDVLGKRKENGRMIIEGEVKYGEFNCTCCSGVYGWYIDTGDIRLLEGYTDLEVVRSIHDTHELLEVRNGTVC